MGIAIVGNGNMRPASGLHRPIRGGQLFVDGRSRRPSHDLQLIVRSRITEPQQEMAFDAHQGRNVRSASVGEFVYLDKRFGREAAKIPERIRIPPFDTYRILPQVGNDIDERCFLHHEINGTTAGQRRDIGAVDRNRKHINLRFVERQQVPEPDLHLARSRFSRRNHGLRIGNLVIIRRKHPGGIRIGRIIPLDLLRIGDIGERNVRIGRHRELRLQRAHIAVGFLLDEDRRGLFGRIVNLVVEMLRIVLAGDKRSRSDQQYGQKSDMTFHVQ